LTLGDPINGDVVALLPDSVFVSALLRITPEYFIKPFLDILSPMHGLLLSVKKFNTCTDILKQFFQPLEQILMARISGGKAFGLVEYRHLLQISASVGDLKSVVRLWERMKKSGIEPDLQCYNSILHASVWERVVYGYEKYRVRVTPYNYRRRRFGVRLRGFGTASRSVRREVNSILEEMQKLGLTLDEDTYINRLLGSARVGSRLDMDRILKEVWMVDVKAIMTKSPDQLPAARPLVESSPIYPTRKLLFAVAHAYGCNSKFKEALLIINYISQQYGIEITDDIWAELFERAFVLSRTRIGRYARANRLGKLDPEILFELKEMLRLDGQPYDMVVYRMLAKSTGYLHQYNRFQEVAREAYRLLRRTRRERNHALRVLENSLNIPLHVDSVSHPIEEPGLRENCEAPHVWRALQKYEKLRLLAEQQQLIIEKIIEYAVSVKRWAGRRDFEFTYRHYPRFLAEWKDFLPESYSITLPTRAGQIEFYGRTNFYDANIRVHNNEPVRWSSCGEFVAEEDEQIQPRHEVLWAHVKDRLGELANLRPLQWFLKNGWNQEPVYMLQLSEPRVSDQDELGKDPSLGGIVEGNVREHQAEQPQEAEHEIPQHCFYVTMIPLYDIAI
jgi:pentatricopeptide repeat protein